MLDLYLPETDYNNVELLICRSCVGPLASYLKFVTVCATTEEKITKYCEQIDTNGQDLVELNHVRLFYNENEGYRKRTLSGNIGSNSQPTDEQAQLGDLLRRYVFPIFQSLIYHGRKRFCVRPVRPQFGRDRVRADGLQIMCEIIGKLLKICSNMCDNRGKNN
ncbi:hypothetical protein NQ317_011355 [Molorchus minor]|uniref:Uncharacterized protein n=1 Tax=Molorchus minor TaxID=1323400 RepID=A0ABQ9IX30_9CUCU|nr:hypothetical protein NQ317_011355 [Molorchus minor]